MKGREFTKLKCYYLEDEYNDFGWRNGKKTFWAEETEGTKAWVENYGV